MKEKSITCFGNHNISCFDVAVDSTVGVQIL